VSELIRVVSAVEAADDACYCDGCFAAPVFVVATPHGPHPACESCVGDLLASLPDDFLQQWKRERALAGVASEDGIPF
jgi:hypothetical protein